MQAQPDKPSSKMNKALLLVATVATVSMTNSYAQDLQPFDRMDVFELEWVSSPQISPDGKRIVYVRNGMDVMTDDKLSRLSGDACMVVRSLHDSGVPTAQMLCA